MPLPTNFSGAPGEELHRTFRNACIEFRHKIKNSDSPEQIQEQMQHIIEIGKQMDWHHKNTGVYHKNEGTKAMDKLWAEFKRYFEGMTTKEPHVPNPKDLLDALSEVERLCDSLKVT